MGSSFNMPCISRNFFLILTGGGKGIFNIFVGLLLYVTHGDETTGFSSIVGYFFVASGFFFIFLSKCSNMTDDQL